MQLYVLFKLWLITYILQCLHVTYYMMQCKQTKLIWAA